MFLFIATACNKEYVTNGYLAPLGLPDSVSSVYGDTIRLQLPAEYDDKVSIELNVNHPGQQVDKEHSLLQLVKEAVEIDRKSNQLTIYTDKLYPTNAFSAEFQNQIPSYYPIVLTANSSTGLKPITKTVKVAVAPSKIYIKNVENKTAVLLPFGLYSEKNKSFDLAIEGLADPTKLNYSFASDYGNQDANISLNNNQLLVGDAAGDKDRKKEFVYTLRANALKNGYLVATRDMKLTLLPDPSFFYGIYYEQYDLKVIYNRFVIALGNAFTSDAPVFNPEKYRGTFKIKEILKDNVSFTNKDALFSINTQTGVISLKKNGSLDAGEYKLKIETTANNGLVANTDFTLVMSPQ